MTDERWESVAQENVGQLTAYKNAIEHASGEKVLESWLFLPISSAALKVGIYRLSEVSQSSLISIVLVEQRYTELLN